MKKRTVTLKQVGYCIEGKSLINLWGGGSGWVLMDSSFIPLNKISKENLLKCVNDGKFGCKGIEKVHIHIYNQFENEHKEFNRSIFVKNPTYHKFYCRGI